MVILLPKMLKKLLLLPEKVKVIEKHWKIFLFSIVGVLFYFAPKEYLGETYPLCLYRIVFNKKCIGCGTTRAIWSILHLDFRAAYDYNKLIIIVFPLLLVCLFYWIFKNKKI